MYTETITQVALAANLNQAANTVLLTFTAVKPGIIRRYGVIADAAQGLLAASRLKLRTVPQTTGTAADITGTTLVSLVKARGFGICKTLTTRVEVAAGDEVTIAVSTDAGAASTGDVWIEVEPLPFQEAELDMYVEST